MKKLVSLLLAAAMCLSLAACGSKNDSKAPSGDSGNSGGGPSDTPTPSTPEPAGAEGDSYVNYPVFSGIEIYEAPSPDDVAETAWAFAGGYTDGHSLTEEDAAEVLVLVSTADPETAFYMALDL